MSKKLQVLAVLLLAATLAAAQSIEPIAAKPSDPTRGPDGYFLRDPVTGTLQLKANEFNMQGPITFAVREVWRFDPRSAHWRQEPFIPPAPKRVVRGARQAFGSASDATITTITDQIGLFWIKWTENQTPYEGFAFSGMACEDVDLRPPPEGFVATCVPYASRAEATYVPDPRKNCVSPVSIGGGSRRPGVREWE
jgi:hypothetical protein